ncbi:serine/threonine-protein phosphatase 6 regulatory subunit 3-like [Paramacrobiotus metropolitanus]|uniref:serine/threonine-protein phosphatase 6 regulatory subunit 3-like n=1 Tax=Paramacrobiotus metropolitanus TaxID=2943436 RepID=UPI0024465B29|nr:serine/threonine-protein phosphatase 6 regulatory subunit 3-like [Paramacrobiotus metropolitanus]XP_055331875.1 serine/threonine-protein phosphatase 6 regulatory subunit 3-like [Paramacrobiotus metropolitanus]
MFWNKFDMMLNKESSVQDVLLDTDPEKVELKDLFEKEDCIQQAKARAPQLIKVLTRPDILRELVNLITEEPAGDLDAKNRFKEATTACEILNADVPEILDGLTQPPGELLELLFGLFSTDQILNPILTSFVTRTLGLLISKKPIEVFTFLKQKEEFLDKSLKHLNVTAITDLYIRLITAHENDDFRYKMCEWLNQQRFMQRVAEYLDVNFIADPDYHFNAAQLISDIIRFSREQQLQQLKPDDEMSKLTPETYANDLLKAADSDDFINQVVGILLKSSSSQSSIVNCISVLGAPFDFIPVNFDGNAEQRALFSELSFIVVNSRIDKYTRILHPVIPQLHDILKNPPVRNMLIAELAEGEVTLTNRVSQTRVQLVRLLALLISFGRPQLNQTIYQSGLIITLLEMFFQFYWNSFFHLHVQNCINLIIRNTPLALTTAENSQNVLVNHPLLHQLLVDGRLQQRIMQAWKENADLEATGKPRRAYMGHVTAISMELSPEQASKNSFVQVLLDEMDASTTQEWNEFMQTSIKPLVDIQSRCLAGVHPLQVQSQPNSGSIPSDVAAFEYDSTSAAPGDQSTEDINMKKHIDRLVDSENVPPGTADQKANQIIDHLADEEMRLRIGDEDEEMDISTDEEIVKTPKVAKDAVSDWPAVQPLHVAEKDGLKRMEEAENANSPWDTAMKSTDGSHDFANWDSEMTSKPAASADEWADFSAFEPGTDNNNRDMFFLSSSQAANGAQDSEDGPFEFRASCLTPEPGEPSAQAVENGEEDPRPTGDINMDPFHGPPPSSSSPLPTGSGDIPTSSECFLKHKSGEDATHSG